MTRFDPSNSSLLDLSDSVCVLTGGSTGIGAATVSLLASHGARVFFGDIAPPRDAPTELDNVTYVKCDVRKYEDIVNLFETALSKHGHVDHAMANAGVVEKGGWFDPSLGIAGLSKGPPESIVNEVNARGVLWFAHIAVQYLAHGVKREDGYRNKSLTLTASIASWLESPGLFSYQASKHSVLGLMRCLRLYLPGAFSNVDGGIRVNSISPSMTNTQMVDGIRDAWIKAGNPVNQPEDVAKVIVACARAGRGSQAVWYDGYDAQGVRKMKSRGGMDWENEGPQARGVSGRNFVVLGGDAWDTEEGLDRTEDLWLGKSPSEKLERGQLSLGAGSDWTKKD